MTVIRRLFLICPLLMVLGIHLCWLSSLVQLGMTSNPLAMSYQCSSDLLTRSLGVGCELMALASPVAVPVGGWLAWHFPFGRNSSLHRGASLATYVALVEVSLAAWFVDTFDAVNWYWYM